MEVLSYGQTLFSVTENGFGKRTSIDEYPVHKRGGKGVIDIKTSQRNGKVVAVKEVLNEDELMLVTAKGVINRQSVGSISVIGRNTQGVRLVKLDEGDKVVDVARVVSESEEAVDQAELSGGRPAHPAGDALDLAVDRAVEDFEDGDSGTDDTDEAPDEDE
jgi:DNA gyrase subunit A